MLIILILLCVGRSAAAATLLRARQQYSHQKPQVCVSLPAFEDAEWIDALLENLRKFTESSTKVALHLDSKTHYDKARLHGWSSDKVAVTSDRISTEVFHGGILYAHLLNAKTLAKQFPNQCTYFVLGASNMFWVRSGMEDYVREHEIAPIKSVVSKRQPTCNFNPFVCDHPITLDMVGGDRHLVAWGQPEGLFMPMKLVLEFTRYLEQWITKNHWNVTEKLVLEYGQFEEFWLQTWALNNAEHLVASHGLKESSPLSFRMLGDGVTMKQVRDVMAGKLRHFAVKRVNRNLNNPTTKYIIALAK